MEERGAKGMVFGLAVRMGLNGCAGTAVTQQAAIALGYKWFSTAAFHDLCRLVMASVDDTIQRDLDVSEFPISAS